MTRMSLCAALALTLGALICGQAEARPHRYYYSAPYVHREAVVKEVVAPIAVPILVPATVFQYLPALQPAIAAPVAVQPVAASTVAAPAVAAPDIDKMIRERIDAILQERSNGDGPPTLILPGDLPKMETPPPAAQQPPAGDPGQQVANLLASKSCVQCHTEGVKTAGNISLFKKQGDQLFFQPGVDRQTILRAVSPGIGGSRPAMPPDGKGNPLNASELAILNAWVNQK